MNEPYRITRGRQRGCRWRNEAVAGMPWSLIIEGAMHTPATPARVGPIVA